MRSGKVSVLTGAHAIRVLIERGRAIGVEYALGDGGRLETARAEREVVVASGAIGSPRLLLLSGIGPADELRAVGIAPRARSAGRRPQPPGPYRRLRDQRALGPHSYDRHTRPHRMLWAGMQYALFRQRAR